MTQIQERSFGFVTSCQEVGRKTPVQPAVAAFAGKTVVDPVGREIKQPQGYLPGDEGTLEFISANNKETIIISGAD